MAAPYPAGRLPLAVVESRLVTVLETGGRCDQKGTENLLLLLDRIGVQSSVRPLPRGKEVGGKVLTSTSARPTCN